MFNIQNQRTYPKTDIWEEQDYVLSTNLFAPEQQIHKPTLRFALYDINEVSFHAKKWFPPSSDFESEGFMFMYSSIQQMSKFKLFATVKFLALYIM